MPPSMWMPPWSSTSRPYSLTSTQVWAAAMTGIGAAAMRSPSQAARCASAAAAASSSGRSCGRFSPVNRTKSRPGSVTAASSAWSTAVSADVRRLARK